MRKPKPRRKKKVYLSGAAIITSKRKSCKRESNSVLVMTVSVVFPQLCVQQLPLKRSGKLQQSPMSGNDHILPSVLVYDEKQNFSLSVLSSRQRTSAALTQRAPYHSPKAVTEYI